MKYINLYFIMFVYFNITAIYVFFFGGGGLNKIYVSFVFIRQFILLCPFNLK